MKNRILLSGNEALAFGARDACVKVVASYPGTPATEIVSTLFNFKSIKSQWSVNEKVAFEVTYGAAVAGARSLYVSKHVGLNVAMDPLMSASYTGINAGFVVVVGDDPGIHSSQNEQDTRWVARYAKLPLLEPANAQEAYQFVQDAFRISEKFDTPVLLRLTTRVCHSKESIDFGVRNKIINKKFIKNPKKFVMLPGYANRRHEIVEKRAVRLKKFSEKTKLNRVELGDNSIGIITSGVIYSYAKELWPEASHLKLGFTYPECSEKIIKFSKTVKKLYLFEALDPILENHIKTLGVDIVTKDPSFIAGELLPSDLPDIANGLKRKKDSSKTDTPAFCKGCAHEFVFKVLAKLKLNVSGDIGCYTLGVFEPYNSIHTVLCMGAGVTIHEGFKLAGMKKNTVGIIGDSTFIHSGITGLINSVQSQIDGLLIILDNSITAMTGGQEHPASSENSAVNIEALVKACGVKSVDIVKPQRTERLNALIKRRLSEVGMSVIIARSPCGLIESKKRQ